jgi:hypothetical protein
MGCSLHSETIDQHWPSHYVADFTLKAKKIEASTFSNLLSQLKFSTASPLTLAWS